MKTRNLLVAMALPTLFAACTAEEIVNQTDNNALNSRALLGDLVANVEGNVASRASWSEEDLAWGAWEEGDAFTAALVDATPGVVDNNLLTNYVWNKNADGEWATTSQMVEGIYSFYSYKDVAKKNDRKAVAFDITAQTTDLDNPTKVIDDYQLFFSPLYDIKAVNTTADNNIDLPLKFYPYYSIGAFKLENTTGQDLKISQVILTGKFASKGSIMAKQIKEAKMFYEVRTDADGNYETSYKLNYNDATAKKEFTAEEYEKVWQTADIDDVAAGSESEILAMNCANWVLADDEEVMIYMNIPANSSLTKVEINVIDEEGEAKKIVVENSRTEIGTKTYSIASSGINTLKFKRNVPVAVFGYTTAGAPKSAVVKAENLVNANGYYIDNEEDLEKLLNTSRGNIEVYNFGELVVNSNVANLIAEYTGGIVTFTNPIDIYDLDNTVKIENITFKENVTIKNDEKNTKGTTVEFGTTVDVIKTLTVSSKSTATLKAGTYENVENKGTLTTYEGAANTEKVKNEGVLVMEVGEAPEATRTADVIPSIEAISGSVKVVGFNPTIELKGGSLEYAAAVVDGENVALTVDQPTLKSTIAANYSITIGADVTMNWDYTTAAQVVKTKADGTVEYYSSIVNNGKIVNQTDTKGLVVYDLTNAGEISQANGVTTEVYIYGTATNDGSIKAGYHYVAKGATLTNNGVYVNQTAGQSYNAGTIIVGVDSETTVESNVISGTAENGRINNTAGAKLKGDLTNQDVYYVMSQDFDLDDLATIRFDLLKVNTLNVQAKFTWDGKAELLADLSTTKLSEIETIEFENNSKFVVPADGQAYIATPNVKINGTVTMSGWDKEHSTAAFQQETTITMAKGASLTISDITMSNSNATTIVGPELADADVTTAALKKANCAKIIVEDATIQVLTYAPEFAVAADYSDVSTSKTVWKKN